MLVPPDQRRWHTASCFACLELVADADLALGDMEAAARSLTACLQAVEVISSGSDLHVMLAAQLRHVTRMLAASAHDNKPEAQWPAGSSSGGAHDDPAVAKCQQAHLLRYGAVADSVMEQLYLHNFNVACSS